MTIAFDGVTKIITLSAGTTSLSVRDVWSRWVDWWLTGDNSKYLIAFRQTGGDVIDAGTGTSIPPYMFLLNGWRIRPQEANHTLTVSDGVLLVEGGGDPFLATLGSFTVRINYQQPVQAIAVSTAGGTGGPSASEIATAVRDALIVELNRMDVAVSSRSSQVSVDDIAAQMDLIESLCNTLNTNVDYLVTAVNNIDINITELFAVMDIVRKYDSNRTKVDPVAKTLTVYQDDAVTPMIVFQLKDRNGINSIDEIAERIPL